MSRTDKTKPFRVKALHADLCFREAHDHSRGECDLPALNAHTPVRSPWRALPPCIPLHRDEHVCMSPVLGSWLRAALEEITPRRQGGVPRLRSWHRLLKRRMLR